MTITFTAPHGLAENDVIAFDGFGRGNADIGYDDINGNLVADRNADAGTIPRKIFDALFGSVVTVDQNSVAGDNTKIVFTAMANTITEQPLAVQADKPAIVVEEDGATIEGLAIVSERVAPITTKTELLNYQAEFAGIGILGRTATAEITLKDVVFIGLRRGLDLDNAPGTRIWTFYGDCENGIRLTNCADSCEGRGIRLFSNVTQTDIVPTRTLGITGVTEATNGRIKVTCDAAHGLEAGERVALSGVNFLPAGTVLYRFTIDPDGSNAFVLRDVGYATSSDFTPGEIGPLTGQVVVGKGDSCALVSNSPSTPPFFNDNGKLGIRLSNTGPLTGVNTGHLVNVQVQGSTTLGGFVRVLPLGGTPQPIGAVFKVDLPWKSEYATANDPRLVELKAGGSEALIAATPGTTGANAGFYAAAAGRLGVRLGAPLSDPQPTQEVRLDIPGDLALGGKAKIVTRVTASNFVLDLPYNIRYLLLGYVRPSEVNLTPSERDGIGIQTSDVDGGYWNAAVKGHKTLFDLDSATMTWLSRRGESGSPGEKGINILNTECVRTGASSDRFNSFGANNKSSAVALSINGTRTRPRFWGEQITDDGVAAVDVVDGGVELWGCSKRGALTRIRINADTEWSGIYGGEFTKEDLILAPSATDTALQRVNMLGYIPAGGLPTSGMESVGAYRHFVRGDAEWLDSFGIEQATGRVVMNQGFVGLPLTGRTASGGQEIRLSADGGLTFTTRTVGPVATSASRVIVFELTVVAYFVSGGTGFAAGDFYLFNPSKVILVRKGPPTNPNFKAIPPDPIPRLSEGSSWGGINLALLADNIALPDTTPGTLQVKVRAPSSTNAVTINWFADLRVQSRAP